MNQEEKLIDYLYGEMTSAEKQAFEQKLQQNPALQKDLEALQESRTFLADLPEVQPPATVITLKRAPFPWKRWAIPASIAASLLLLLQLFDFQATTTENGLTFSFGTPVEKPMTPILPPSDNITLAEVQQLIVKREAVHQQQSLLLDSIWQKRQANQMNAMQSKLNQQMLAYQSQQKTELQDFANNFRQEEIPELANLMQNLLEAHQQKTQVFLGEAWTSWQETRNNDLNLIKSEFANVYQNQTETDALLINVIGNSDD